jgi:hypothetical protein
MIGTRLARFEIIALMGIVAVLVIPGSVLGDEGAKSESPPELTLDVVCSNGLMGLNVRNSGGSMTEAGLFEAVFADGERDTLYLKVGADASTSCRLSNIHGGVKVTNAPWGLTASSPSCLDAVLGNLLVGLDFNSLIPRPLINQDITVCTYKIYLNKMTYEGPAYELVPSATGLILKYTFSNIRAAIDARGSSWACADIDGILKTGSLVSHTNIIINEGGNPEASLGDTTIDVTGLKLEIDGVLGFLADWLTEYFEGDLAEMLEGEIESRIKGLAGSDLDALVTVNSGCAE